MVELDGPAHILHPFIHHQHSYLPLGTSQSGGYEALKSIHLASLGVERQNLGVQGCVAAEQRPHVIGVGMGLELCEQSAGLDIPGVKQLPLAVEVAAIEEAPAIEAVRARIDSANHERGVLQACLVAAGSKIAPSPAK